MDAVLEVLTKGREHVKKGWTQGTYARDGSGNAVDVGSYRAVKFCAAGALMQATVDTGSSFYYGIAYDRLTEAVRKQTTIGDSVPQFNDRPERTKGEVLKAFDAAIEKRKKELS